MCECSLDGCSSNPTGSQVVRAVFPNPRGLLLPGMYARAELVEGTRSNGLTVPIRAVSRDERGNPTALVVGQDGKLQVRRLTAPRTIGQNWLVTGGLRAGDKVVVEGAQNLQPGTPVKAVSLQQGGRQAGQPAQTDRKSGGKGKSVSVRVDLGGR